MHRTRRNLTQRALAARTQVPRLDRSHATVSSRTILVIERPVPPGPPWVRPRLATVRALAEALELQSGTPDHAAFLAAARVTNGDPGAIASPSTAIGNTSFIEAGRIPHLRRLRQAIGQALRGDPGMLFVEAGPGTGKTTLMAEACREAIDAYPDLTVLWGACMDSGSSADPQQPIRRALGMLAGDIDSGEPHVFAPHNQRRIAARLTLAIEALATVGASLVDREVPAGILRAHLAAKRVTGEAAHQLATLLDTPPPPPAHVLSTHEAVFRVLKHYTGGGPVILALDDLQWADDETASLLFHLGRRMKTQPLPLLVIGTFRPPPFAGGDPGRHAPFTAILPELLRAFPEALLDLSTAVGGAAGRAFIEALVTTAVGRAPLKLRHALYAQTAGLPLFARGMLQWYQSTGRLGPGPDGTIEFDPPADIAALPAEIDALFAGLVGRLPAPLRQVLDAASVQGVTFAVDVVRRLLGLSPADAIDRIDRELVRRFALIAPGGAREIAGVRSHAYQFSHALLRDYVYHQLPVPERTRLHLATAEAVCAIHGHDEHEAAATIAMHFELAGDRRRAAAAFIQAGLHAMALRDYRLARARFGRVGALDLGDDGAYPTAQALIGLGNCAHGEGHNAHAAHLFQEAGALAWRANLPVIEATSLACIGRLDFDAGRLDDAARRLAKAVALFADHGEHREACRFLTLLSHTRYGLGRYDDAAAAARQAIALATGLGDEPLLAGAMTALANCWLDLGLYDEAVSLQRESIDRSEERNDTHRAALGWYNIALCAIEREAWDEATAALEPMLGPGRRVTSRLVAAAACAAGMVAEGRGWLDEAIRHYQRSLDLRTANGQAALAIDSLAGLLRVATAHGDVDAIASLRQDLRARLETRGVDGVEHPGRLFLTLTHACLACDDHEGARTHVRDGIAFVTSRARLLADPTHRESYLRRVPSHRRLTNLAAGLGMPVDASHRSKAKATRASRDASR